MFLLDTNVVSELRKVRAGRADPNVAAWSSGVSTDDLFISAITLLELEIGALSVERRDPIQGGLLKTWIERSVIAAFANRILPVDVAVVRRCAPLHVPDRRSDRDALIAATALVLGMTVVTRNVSDFAPTGVAMSNPWDSSAD
ncbi:MAG: type II toxin-antitoxin system VapC family toxin [Geminicoccaceae bacterium]